ncbi:MAG: arginine decarboxylase, partial [Gammaproteobacteria bacterium]|nr:arginine decarboxylase [Gammaproteobacteria bacterium]
IGAYQEILGDLHNLFGDTHAVHIRMEGSTCKMEQIIEGESVSEVLDHVQFHESFLVDRMCLQVESARSDGKLNADEAKRFLQFYRQGLKGYTYLEGANAPHLT